MQGGLLKQGSVMKFNTTVAAAQHRNDIFMSFLCPRVVQFMSSPVCELTSPQIRNVQFCASTSYPVTFFLTSCPALTA